MWDGDVADAPPAAPDAGADAAPPALCVAGTPTVAYPPGPHAIGIAETLPPGLTFEGKDGPVVLDDYFDPCAAKPKLLVVRTSAAWCGPCIWHAEHTKRLLVGVDAPFADRIALVDLLMADADDMPARATDLAAWAARVAGPAERRARRGGPEIHVREGAPRAGGAAGSMSSSTRAR